LAGSIATLVFFSLFVQAAEGALFAIVPYVDPPNMGSIIGIVGAGGNVGAVAFGIAFRELDYATAFTIMGVVILGSSVLSLFIIIEGHAGILWGKDMVVNKETGKVVESKGRKEELEQVLVRVP
jgi:NNP family nitrate/nitrite transporter-like MFS transporter